MGRHGNMEINNSELVAQMRRFEDHFVERKTVGDRKDWLKTIVAFANSTPDGSNAILFIGVTREGRIEDHESDLDTVQKTLNKELGKAYPPIQCQSTIVEEHGRKALALIIPSSKNRPHFSGPAYVRRLSETFPASEQEFSELIARRNSMVSKILDYKGKWVTVMNSRFAGPHIAESVWPPNASVYDCNRFFLTLAIGDQPRDRQSFPLEMVTIAHDHSRDTLLIKLNR